MTITEMTTTEMKLMLQQLSMLKGDSVSSMVTLAIPEGYLCL